VLRSILAALVLVAGFALVAPAQDAWDGVERIVAVGDVHGDLGPFLTVLKDAGLIDEKRNWTGGRAHLVQLGDRVDRGPDSRKVMDLLMSLEDQARRAGGRVHPLIGNHEAMNVYGDLRYVTPAEYEEFSSKDSARLRDGAYQQHLDELKASMGSLPNYINQNYRKEWEEKHPLGAVEHQQAWGAKGKYGQWIRRQNAVIRINDSLFLHGGIGPKYARDSLTEMNNSVRKDLRDVGMDPDRITADQEGPLWFRGLARQSNDMLPHLAGVLKRHKVSRMVIAHTPTSGTVMPLYGGRIIMTDVGLSSVYGGAPACLLIENGKLSVMHRGTKVEFPADAASLPPYLARIAELEPAGSKLKKALAGAKPDEPDRQP
jgi:hypothetical protein